MKNMTIGKKLMIPMVAMGIMVAFLVFEYRQVAGRMDQTETYQNHLGAAVRETRQLAEKSQAFCARGGSLDTLAKTHGAVMASMVRLSGKDALHRERMADVLASLKRVQSLHKRLSEMEHAVVDMTRASIGNSREYVKLTAQRLADPKQERAVTTLERLVIVGADVNTSTNYEVQTLFLRLKHDPAVESEIKKALDVAIANATRDIERLKNTPFAQMAVEAQKANREIKRLSEEYLRTSQQLAATSDGIQTALGAACNDLQQASVALGRDVFAQFRTILRFLVGGVAMIAVLMGFLYFALARAVTRPIRRTAAMLKDIAEGEGDLTRRLEVTSQDEVGEMARYFNGFVEKLQGIIARITDNVTTVASSATELSATATQLAGGAETTTNQSAQVASAAEQMSASMTTMSASTEQMSQSVTAVSAAIEQSTASIGEMAKSAERTAEAAANAIRLVDAGNAQISELGNAAKQIGKVIEVIQDIAEQTNLLALNATIEAARAGDAGKGFAVVATEVKELAKQTAGATEDIRQRIEGIQNSTGLTVESMGGISDVIRQVNDLSRIIASAVEEQSITTREIARSVAQSSTAAQTVAKGVAESASASQEIARIIVGVDQAARQTAQGASQTQTTGRELSSVAERLRSLTGQFKV